ncbi:MAG: hypothetical protein JRG86_21135 [Deltaproteobacteria bacterium]|jgi:hypothetical protein|nr:hypothetical protein [Deltaproteobacteria bacterium]MBW2497835.1 hypothetical protein [Deltaproteobacteria bacterium]
MLWGKQQGARLFDLFVDRAYERFWCRNLDIEDVAVLESLLQGLGGENEVISGRQHLPMIRWALERRRAPGPV